MNGTQYEEFCRLFITHELGIPIEKIISDNIPSAIRPGLEEYKNQIDLCWEYEDKLTRNFIIVNAKWRGSEKDKVDQPDVLLIQQVKQEIAANKAMIITNTDFTSGARRAAENHRIALHIARPNFDYTILDLDAKNREQIHTQLQEPFSSNEPYMHTIVHRAFDLGTDSEVQSGVPHETISHSKEVTQTPVNRMAPPPSNRRAPSGTQKVQGGQSGSPTGGRGGSGKKGPGPARGGGRAPRRR